MTKMIPHELISTFSLLLQKESLPDRHSSSGRHPVDKTFARFMDGFWMVFGRFWKVFWKALEGHPGYNALEKFFFCFPTTSFNRFK